MQIFQQRFLKNINLINHTLLFAQHPVPQTRSGGQIVI